MFNQNVCEESEEEGEESWESVIESDMIECGRGCIERARERWCGWIWRDDGERLDEGGNYRRWEIGEWEKD